MIRLAGQQINAAAPSEKGTRAKMATFLEERMKRYSVLSILLTLILLPALATGLQDEVYGRVSHVVDGDTFDLVVSQGNDRVSAGDTIRIRLADIDCPETRGAKACPEGKKATEYARAWLINNFVFLDLDNKTGKDQYGRWVAVVYLVDSDGSIIVIRINFYNFYYLI